MMVLELLSNSWLINAFVPCANEGSEGDDEYQWKGCDIYRSKGLTAPVPLKLWGEDRLQHM